MSQLQQARKLLTQANTEEKFWEAVNILGYKFLSIPVAFILLRVWTCLEDLVYVYFQPSETPFWLDLTFQYLTISSARCWRFKLGAINV